MLSSLLIILSFRVGKSVFLEFAENLDVKFIFIGLPKFAKHLLHWFCDQQYLEEVEGDLEEIFMENVEKIGGRKAKRIYWMDVLRHIRPYFIKKRSLNLITQNQTAMWTIYLKIAIRNFWKNKIISVINTSGLSLGLACCIIIFFHIKDELSYDQFVENGDTIYRVLNVDPRDERPYDAGGPPPLGPVLVEEFAGIEEAVRLWEDYNPTITRDDQVFVEYHFVFADQRVFPMFSLALLKGDPKTALSTPNSVVLTKKMVKKYFGDQDPMGKTLEYRGGRGKFQLLVTGVMDDLPHNTHFKFDFLASFLSVGVDDYYWGSFKPIWTYITLQNGVSPDQIRAGFPAFAKKYVPDRVEESPGFSFDLEPMSEIYLQSKADRNMKPLGDVQSIYILGIVGISILLIACINFINLTMSNSLVRMKEVGVRKIMGARKAQLIRQFLIESGLTIFFALIISIVLSVIFLPLYNDFAGKQVSSYLLDLKFVTYILSSLVGATVLASFYPARFIAKSTGTIVGRNSDKASTNAGARKGFVVFQFLVSTILIVSILIIKDQQAFINNKELGINKDHVLVIPTSRDETAFLQKLGQMPEVENFGISQRLPVNVMNYDGRSFEVEGQNQEVSAQSCIIDLNFIETYGIEIVAGRNHFKEQNSQWEFLINESAVRDFGFETPEKALGKKIIFDRGDNMIGNVIGVFEDFHLESLHEKIPPMIMFKNVSEKYVGWGRQFISIKYQTDDLASFNTRIEEMWKSHNEGRAYFSFFIDDSYAELHDADYRFAKLFNYVTFIAVLIACMGLLGLSMLIVNQKIKEIGIRKVLGATVVDVTVQLSKNFVILVMLGLFLASPLAFYLMDRWLDSFSYRIDISIQPFALTLLIVALLSILTIVVHTTKAALANPAESLKDE